MVVSGSISMCYVVSIVVSVLIHVGGEDEGLGGAYVVWSMLQIYYLARGRQFVSAYALSMVSVTKIHMYKVIIGLMSEGFKNGVCV